jgi:hypothetical protein
MTRLDENRAKIQLALKAGFHWGDVTALGQLGKSFKHEAYPLQSLLRTA